MTKQEFLVISATLQTYYPRFNLLPNQEAMSLWFDGLKDLRADVLSAALKKWAMTEKWPPSIAELREKCGEIINGDRPDWGTGWAEVQKAIRLYGYMQPQKALASMGAVTREAVNRIGWQAICESENPETIRAQFRQVYEVCEGRMNTENNLPPELKESIALIRGVADNMKMLK